MKFFKSATERLVTKEVEYKLHEKVLRDLANDKKDLGVWGKSFVDADGDDKKTEAIYIKLMVQHYKDTAKSEAELEAIWNENYQREQAEKAKKKRIENEKKTEKKRIAEEEHLEKLEEDKHKYQEFNLNYFFGALVLSGIAYFLYSIFTS